MKNLSLTAATVVLMLGCGGAEDLSCTQTGCSAGLTCAGDASGAMRCIVVVPPGVLGERCEDSAKCLSSLTCSGCTTTTCTTALPSVCSEKGQVGERCLGSSCNPNLRCVGSLGFATSGICSADATIPASRTCKRLNGAVSTCKPSAGVDGRCEADADCEYPLFCDQAGTRCVRPGQAGEACQINRPCAPGLLCDPSQVCRACVSGTTGCR